MNSTDYREIIQRRFTERRLRNPAYSLRAYARDLKVSVSHLSGILSGKEKLSRIAGQKIGVAIGLSRFELDIFLDEVDAMTARSPNDRKLAAERLKVHQKKSKFKRVEKKNFSLISDWFHLAILSGIDVLKNNNIDVTTRSLARLLKLHESEAARSVAMLNSLGFISVADGVILSKNCVNVESTAETSSEANRNFHAQILLKSSDSILNQSPLQRSLNSMVLAFPKSKLQEADKLINDFCREFNKHFEHHRDNNSVYCLATQLFELGSVENVQLN